MSALIAIPLGLLIGVILGLVGAGGSIIAVPALVYGVGLSLKDAIPASLIIVGLAALSAVIPRIRRSIAWTTAAIVGAAGIPAAWAGAAVNRLLDANVLLLAFAGLMIVSALRMLTSPAQGTTAERNARNMRTYLPKALLVGLVVGFLTGLFGIGGGFIITPALALLLGLKMSIAVGTSLVIIVINSAAGFTAHLHNSALDWPLVLLFSAAAIIGSLIAARFATRLPDQTVKITFAVLILLVAAFVLIRSITDLATAGI
ncbi:sulfite exporter TauE/SafE family protein [Microbacterium sp. KRD172]|uniref:sulfite exporter TauE/SafE family protein n=1 Tax=Microbacterium sp. KRD172 TaxID=2729727 RepID=UPI0019D29735|nr:sulfite exporter TauE/SafE family protein [Microbacterium sp. KRD172]